MWPVLVALAASEQCVCEDSCEAFGRACQGTGQFFPKFTLTASGDAVCFGGDCPGCALPPCACSLECLDFLGACGQRAGRLQMFWVVGAGPTCGGERPSGAGGRPSGGEKPSGGGDVPSGGGEKPSGGSEEKGSPLPYVLGPCVGGGGLLLTASYLWQRAANRVSCAETAEGQLGKATARCSDGSVGSVPTRDSGASSGQSKLDLQPDLDGLPWQPCMVPDDESVRSATARDSESAETRTTCALAGPGGDAYDGEWMRRMAERGPGGHWPRTMALKTMIEEALEADAVWERIAAEQGAGDMPSADDAV